MDEQEFTTMNIIPLVDVMLVLLTIVLTTSTFIATGAIQVELPQTRSTAEPVRKPVTVAINRDGEVFLDQQRCLLPELSDQLSALSQETPILIRADKNIALQEFVEVLDLIKSLGFSSVSLQTEKLP